MHYHKYLWFIFSDIRRYLWISIIQFPATYFIICIPICIFICQHLLISQADVLVNCSSTHDICIFYFYFFKSFVLLHYLCNNIPRSINSSTKNPEITLAKKMTYWNLSVFEYRCRAARLLQWGEKISRCLENRKTNAHVARVWPHFVNRKTCYPFQT